MFVQPPKFDMYSSARYVCVYLCPQSSIHFSCVIIHVEAFKTRMKQDRCLYSTWFYQYIAVTTGSLRQNVSVWKEKMFVFLIICRENWRGNSSRQPVDHTWNSRGNNMIVFVYWYTSRFKTLSKSSSDTWKAQRSGQQFIYKRTLLVYSISITE